MKKIQLGGHKKNHKIGKKKIEGYALVDDADFEWLNKFNWYLAGSGPRKYAGRSHRINKNKVTTMLMHALIMKTPKGMDTDHINGNKLDNRRKNLRICDRSTNNLNRCFLAKNNKSGHTGVFYDKIIKSWRVTIMKNRRQVIQKHGFKTKQQAVKYRRRALKKFLVPPRLGTVIK